MQLLKWIAPGTARLRDRLAARRTLFWKYVVLFTLVTSVALVIDGLVDIWFTFRDHRAALVRIQKEQAISAASKITEFIEEIEAQLGWTTHLSWETTTIEQRALDGRERIVDLEKRNHVILILSPCVQIFPLSRR